MFQLETFVDCREEIGTLLDAYNEESGATGWGPELDVETYARLEQLDLLHILTAREQGKLVGFAVMMIGPDLGYRGRKLAVVNLLFLHPDYRKGIVGRKMIEAVEDTMRVLGADRVALATRPQPDLSPLYERMGYQRLETNYAKVL